MIYETFSEWSNWFINCVREIKQQRNYAPNKGSFLFLGGHITRNNNEVMKKIKKEYIDVIISQPHMTH